MNADILATLFDYTTYKMRWQLTALYSIFHPLIAILIIKPENIKIKLIYTLSNIFAYKNFKYEYNDISISKYISHDSYYLYDSNIFGYEYIPYQHDITFRLYISDLYTLYITLIHKNLNVNIEIRLFYMDDAHSEISTLIEEEYKISNNTYLASHGDILDIFTLLDKKL